MAVIRLYSAVRDGEVEGMSEALIMRCEDSLEGIFTAVYDAFVQKNKMEKPYTDSISIAPGEGCMRLFAREILVRTDARKVERTVYSIQTRLGYFVYDTLLRALCHYDEERATVVLGYLVRAFAQGRDISGDLSDPYVLRVMELSRKVENERQKFYGFLRFRDTGNVLVARVEPKCNLVPLMMEHFTDRFPNENFIIYDEKRKIAAVHEAFHSCVLAAGIELDRKQYGEDAFEILWKQYVSSMEIRQRHNEKCQSTMMPKWYRKNMCEWKDP